MQAGHHSAGRCGLFTMPLKASRATKYASVHRRSYLLSAFMHGPGIGFLVGLFPILTLQNIFGGLKEGLTLSRSSLYIGHDG